MGTPSSQTGPGVHPLLYSLVQALWVMLQCIMESPPPPMYRQTGVKALPSHNLLVRAVKTIHETGVRLTYAQQIDVF